MSVSLANLSVYIPLGFAMVGAIIWSIRLEGRINLADQKFEDLKELINARFDSSDNRLGRIERSLNGHLKD